MLKTAVRAAACAVVIALSGCASTRIPELIKKMRGDPIHDDGRPSETMKKLAECGPETKQPILDALTADEKEYNVSLVRTLTLIKEGVEPETYAELLAHPGRGVAETAQEIVLDPNTRNLTEKLTAMLREHDPQKSSEPGHDEEVYRKVLFCLGEAGGPPAVPGLCVAIRQPDSKTRGAAMQALFRLFDRLPWQAVKGTIDARYYDFEMYFTLRSVLLTETNAEVCHYASRALEAYSGASFGVFAKTQEQRDREREKRIVGRYDEWVVWENGMSDYPNRPVTHELARRLNIAIHR